MLKSFIEKVLGLGGLFGAAWAIANGIFFAHVLSLIPHCPTAISVIIGAFIGLVTLLQGTVLFSVLLAAGVVGFFTGKISKKGLILGLIVAAVSVVFTHALVGWTGLAGPEAIYLLVVWNIVVFVVVSAIGSGVSLAAGLAASAADQLFK